jgi:hypothetical protein
VSVANLRAAMGDFKDARDPGTSPRARMLLVASNPSMSGMWTSVKTNGMGWATDS